MKSITLILVACFLRSASADEIADIMANSMIDTVKNSPNWDPMLLSPRLVNISRHLGGLWLHGHADVRNGSVIGLSSLTRLNEANMTLVNGSTVANLHLGVANLTISSDAEVHFLGDLFHPRLKVDTSVGNLTFHITVSAGSDGTKMTYFKIDHYQDITFNVDGFGPLNWLIQWIANTVLAHVDGIARPIIDRHIVGPVVGGVVKRILNRN